MKLLVAKVSALGDVVHTLPVLPYLKSVDPGMEIHWLVEEQIAPLLEAHPAVHRVWRIRTKQWRGTPVRGAFSMLASGMALRRERFDVVLDLQGNSKSGFFTWMTGAPGRFGFDAGEAREWPNRLATNCKIALPEKDRHVTDRALAVTRGACPGGQVPFPARSLSSDPEARRGVKRKFLALNLDPDRVVVLHCGTSWKTKQWARDNWTKLLERLQTEFGLQPVLTWGNHAEFDFAEKISSDGNSAGVVWPGEGLPDLVALLKEARLMIGPDTGPVHIAAAVGTATVSLFRATEAARNGPRGDGHVRLQSPFDCSPCLKKECSRNDDCAGSIPVSTVLAGVKGILGE